MDEPNITVKKVKNLVKVPWRLRLKWWWMNRRLKRQGEPWPPRSNR